MTTTNPEYETHNMLCLSTAHLSTEAKDMLDEACDEASVGIVAPIIVYEKCGYGWFLPVDVNLEAFRTQAKRGKLPCGLASAFAAALMAGADWLMFDCDGPIIEGMPTYSYSDSEGEDGDDGRDGETDSK